MFQTLWDQKRKSAFGRKEMVKYREDRENIIQSVEIDLTEIPDQSRQNIESKITYLNYISAEHKKNIRI